MYAITSICLSGVLSVFFLHQQTILQLITVFALLLVTVYLVRLPTTYQQQLS